MQRPGGGTVPGHEASVAGRVMKGKRVRDAQGWDHGCLARRALQVLVRVWSYSK